MLTRRQTVSILISVAYGNIQAQNEKYAGPVPPKKDIPYLLLADKLVATEMVTASQSSEKNEDIFVVPGETSPARTPLAEPIFLLSAERLTPANLGLFRFEVTGGKRQITISKKKGKGPRAYHTSVRALAPNLFRIEAAEYLDIGEYSLSPEGENTAFCFTVF
jgi:hypothetical protein